MEQEPSPAGSSARPIARDWLEIVERKIARFGTHRIAIRRDRIRNIKIKPAGNGGFLTHCAINALLGHYLSVVDLVDLNIVWRSPSFFLVGLPFTCSNQAPQTTVNVRAPCV